MKFDWFQYLDLASELCEQARKSGHSDANWRSSISRAYYATYHKARQQLKDKWGISVPKSSNSHQLVQKEFEKKKQSNIAQNLRRMRVDRNDADYDDTFKNLENITRENIRRAREVLLDLCRL